MRGAPSVTAWPSWHYFLSTGTLAVGKDADIVIVDDLKGFKVREVYIAGNLVAKDGRALFTPTPIHLEGVLFAQARTPEEFQIKHAGPKAKVRVIKVIEDQVESYEEEAELPVLDGIVQADISKDVLYLAVVNRYQQAPVATAFVRGFGLKRGAIASTVAHDSHNIIAVGTDPGVLCSAINKVSGQGGYHVTDGRSESSIILDVVGLMSTDTCAEVTSKVRSALEMLKGMGCKLPSPFTTLSFQSLLVVPELKLSDKGLFDSRNMRFVDILK